MFFKKETNPVISKYLHFIWIGSVLRDKGKENIKAWRETNPDYEIIVWYDSSVFPSKKDVERYEGHQQNFDTFKSWASNNNIKAKDINDIYPSMENRVFYDHAITGIDANFAEASDIARIEILKKFGGIYFDVEDIFPKRSLGTLTARHGFLCRLLLDEGKFNNDIIAAVPGNIIVINIIKKMRENYNKHYQKSREIYAHRSSIFGGFKFGIDSRKNTTIAISGPCLIQDTINEVTLFPSGEKLEKAYSEMGLDTVSILSNQYYGDFNFPEDCYEVPLHQAASWGLAKVLKDNEAFQKHFEYCLLLKYAKELKKIITIKYENIFSQKINSLTKILPNCSITLTNQIERKLISILGNTTLNEDKGIQKVMSRLNEDERILCTFLNLFLTELSENEKAFALMNFYHPPHDINNVLEMLRPDWNKAGCRMYSSLQI